MKLELLPGGSLIAVSDAFKQRQAVQALPGAEWAFMHKLWLVPASPANVAALAALCPAIPPEIQALMPAVERRAVLDDGVWLTYDASLYDPSLVVYGDEGEVVADHNRDRAKEPWEHQRLAVGTILDLFASGSGAAALMEQRTGKARVSIEVFARLHQAGEVNRVLVVSLTTPCGDYERQVVEYLDGYASTALLFGTRSQRLKALHSLSGPLQVAIINYESAWRLVDELIAWRPQMAIADEMHKIKRPPTKQSGKTSAGMHKIADVVGYRLGMTGTATPNSPLDLYSEYRFCEPSVFGDSFYAMKAVYAVEGSVMGKGGKPKTYTRQTRRGQEVELEVKTVVGYQNLDKFQKKMHSIAFVRRMEECHDLPPVSHLIVPVPLNPKAAKAYREMEADSVVAWEDGETSATNVLVRKLRLHQIASGFVPHDDGETMEFIGDEKISAFLDLSSGIFEAGGKVVAYARFSNQIEAAVSSLEKAGIGVVEISGRIPKEERFGLIERFQKDPETRCLVAQIQAGGVGIDLSAADTEIFISKTHEFGAYDQARARIVHGSKRSKLTYYHLVAPGTVDEEIEASRELKCDLSLFLLQRPGNPFKREAS